jgi:hypothetical protein
VNPEESKPAPFTMNVVHLHVKDMLLLYDTVPAPGSLIASRNPGKKAKDLWGNEVPEGMHVSPRAVPFLLQYAVEHINELEGQHA